MKRFHGRARQPLARHSPVVGTIRFVESAQDSLRRLRSQDRGAAMVEYGLLLVLVALAAFFTVQVFGETLLELFETTVKVFDDAAVAEAGGE